VECVKKALNIDNTMGKWASNVYIILA
jgi:hypothetical protein